MIATSTILDLFGAASGLHVNPSNFQPLKLSVDLLHYLPGNFQPFPCPYLGVPLSIRKLSKTDLQPLVDKVRAGLPTWKAKLMSKAGRAVLVKVKISALVVHTAIAVALSSWAIGAIDKHRRAFLRKGTELVAGSASSLGQVSAGLLTLVVEGLLIYNSWALLCISDGSGYKKQTQRNRGPSSLMSWNQKSRKCSDSPPQFLLGMANGHFSGKISGSKDTPLQMLPPC